MQSVFTFRADIVHLSCLRHSDVCHQKLNNEGSFHSCINYFPELDSYQ